MRDFRELPTAIICTFNQKHPLLQLQESFCWLWLGLQHPSWARCCGWKPWGTALDNACCMMLSCSRWERLRRKGTVVFWRPSEHPGVEEEQVSQEWLLLLEKEGKDAGQSKPMTIPYRNWGRERNSKNDWNKVKTHILTLSNEAKVIGRDYANARCLPFTRLSLTCLKGGIYTLWAVFPEHRVYNRLVGVIVSISD